MSELREGTVVPASFSLGQALSWGGSVPLQPPLPLMAEVRALPGSLPSLAQELERVPEHRHPRGFKAHQPPVPLIPTLLLMLVAALCGRLGYLSMAEWGRLCSWEQPEVLDALGFPRGRKPRTPVGATLFRMVRDMDLVAFQQALEDWLGAVAGALHLKLPEREKRAVPADQIALDGKRVRGASERRGGGDPEKTGLHLVAAYVPALRTVLDQLATEGKGRELAAVEMLLGRLPLKDRVITGDALLTQREVCKDVLEGGGDYLLPVKENQPALLKDIQEAFSPLPLPDPEDPKPPEPAEQERLLRMTLPDAHLTVVQERAVKAKHGRYEARTLWAIASVDLNGYLGSAGTVGKPWPGVKQVCRIQRVVASKDRKSGTWKTTAEVSYSITSLGSQRAAAAELLKRWRVHWHIENRLHWVRDVTFGEDACPIHKGQAPEVFAVLRNAAISLLGWAPSPSIAATVRDLGARPCAALEFFAGLSERLNPVGGWGEDKPRTDLLSPGPSIPPRQPVPATSARPRDGPH